MNYSDKRRRHRVKKMVRLNKPYLVGVWLDLEVDRLLGISDSGKMDWAMTKKVEISDHLTPNSVTEDEVRETAKEFGIRPYHLYWFFLQKVTKYQASGKEKHNYLAVLRECAAQAIKKELSNEEKITAVLLFGQFTGVSVTRQQAELMIFKGEI